MGWKEREIGRCGHERKEEGDEGQMAMEEAAAAPVGGASAVSTASVRPPGKTTPVVDLLERSTYRR